MTQRRVLLWGTPALALAGCSVLAVSLALPSRSLSSTVVAEGGTTPRAAEVRVTPNDQSCLRPGNDCTALERERATSPADIVFTPPDAEIRNPSRQQALDNVLKQAAVVRRNDKIAAKLSTLGAYQNARRANGIDVGAGVQPPDTLKVWLVAVQGEIVPPYAKGRTFSWAIFIYDAASGTALGMEANDGPLPAHYTSLPDEAVDRR